MLKQTVKNDEIVELLNEALNYYVSSKKLTLKKADLIYEYTQYLKHRVDGKTETQRIAK